ncbi:MAG: hypothetical protein ABI091_23445 [Ferruginibacter sp.]
MEPHGTFFFRIHYLSVKWIDPFDQEQLNIVNKKYAVRRMEDEELYQNIKRRFTEEIKSIGDEMEKVDLKLSSNDNFIHYSIKLLNPM